MQKPILYLILCLAALVRLYNLDHGLPEIYEEATPMRQAWEIWRGADGGLDFNPHFFNYPAFYFYLQFFGQAVYFVLNLLIGRLHALEDMYQLYESDPTEIVLIARFVNISFGLGSVWATYRLGCMLHNRQVGLFASAILALAPIPVRTSRIILVDTPLLFFGTLSLIQCMQVFKENKLSDNLWAGAWIGLASACKYTGTLFIIPFLTAHILRNRSLHSLLHQKKRIAAGLLFAAFIFFLTNPYLLLDFSTFWTDFSFERTHMALGHFGVDANRTITTYLQDLWYNFGFSLIPFLLWGFILIGKSANSHLHEIPILAFTAVYLMLISTWSMNAAHYLLPIFPPLAIVTATGIQNFLQRIKQSVKVAIPITLLIIAPISLHTFQNLIDNAKTDTRVEAKRWVTNHIPQGALIATEYYTPDLPAEKYHLLRLPMDAVRPELVAPFYDTSWYTNFDYIITSDGVSARYEAHPEKFTTQIQFYNDLQNNWQQMASFSDESFSGPVIRIFKNTGLHKPNLQYTAQQYDKLIGKNTQVATDLLSRLADLFTQKEWYAKAIDVHIHQQAIAPQKTDIPAKLGFLFYQTGQIENAIQAWQEALQIDPQNITLLTNLGAIYLQKGNIAQAVQYWERGLLLSPADPDLINNLVFVYRQNNQIDRAIETLQNALKIAPSNPNFQSALTDLKTP
jgi:Flp pilus assembly protein TadD